MPTSDADQDREAVDTDGFTRILYRRHAMLVFVAIVFAATTVQVLADPVSGLIQGNAVWNGTLSLQAALSVAVAGCALQSAFLLLSPRMPLIAVLGTTACYLALVVEVETPRWFGALPLVVAVAVFFYAAHRPPIVAAAWTILVIAGAIGVLLLWAAGIGIPASAISSFLLGTGIAFGAPVAGAAALGMWWGRRMRVLRRTREQLAAATAKHEAELEEARARERARIAQELHDVAGQHLAGLLSLADAAVDIDDLKTTEATTLIAEMRAEGRFASASLYAALRDLRAENGARAERTHDLRSLDELVAYWTSRGMDVRVRCDAGVEDLPAMVSTTAYRIAQEALTNACKHAVGASTSVEVDISPTVVRVAVTNGPGRTPAGSDLPEGLGWGLTGMAERVELLHGVFTAGPVPSGGWAVVMEAPISAHQAPTSVSAP